MKTLILFFILFISCSKEMREEKTCWTCITQTNWYPNNEITYDTFLVCDEDSFRAMNGWGRTYADALGNKIVHKWTICK